MARYQIEYTALVWDARALSNEFKRKTFSVPWFWMAHAIVWIRRHAWLMGGQVIDTLTGKVNIKWELTGNILSDGQVHLTVFD